VFVFKVLVVECLAIHPNELSAELTVELSIKYVRYRVSPFTWRAGCSIVQQLDGVLVEKHRLKAGAYREMLELHPGFSRFVIPRLFTIGERATVQVFV
jgi:hypothetical protein